MIVPVYLCGRSHASFDGRPGYRPQSLVVPGGSALLPTALEDGVHTLLFVPSNDPAVRIAWSAKAAIQAARSGKSRFRLIDSPFQGQLR